MDSTHSSMWRETDLKTPIRNRFFYGKLMDELHFKLETDYVNAKRWLLNRLISGYGVVCGLNVQRTDHGSGIKITAGMALDKWGREIIVPNDTASISLPAEIIREAVGETEKEQAVEEVFIHVLLCYCEREANPAPILAGDCQDAGACAPGLIKEGYEIIFREGEAPAVSIECHIPDVISRGEIDYDTLVRWVSGGCPEFPADPCIPLANIRVAHPQDEQRCHPNEIDITVRPIVYTNDLLFELLLSLLTETPSYRRGK